MFERIFLPPVMDDSRPIDHVEPDLRKPAGQRVGIWEDFVDIFYDPSAVFERRENGSVFIPMMVVTVAMAVLFFVNMGVLEPIMAAETQRAMAQMGMEAELASDQAAAMQKYGGIFAGIGTLISMPIAIALVGLLVWVVGRIFGSTQTIHAAMIVAAYAYIPRILGAIVVGVHGFFMEPAQLTGMYTVTLSAARFLDPTTASPVALALLGRIDLFTLWVTVLLAIGLRVTGRISRDRAILAGFLIWLIPTLGALGTPLMRELAK